MVTEWLSRSTNDGDSALVYALEHKYTDASIRLSKLKTADLARAKVMYALSIRNDFDLYLASMEREVWGNVDDEYDNYHGRRGWNGYNDDWEDPVRRGYHEITETHMKSLTLKRVVDTDGVEKATDLEVGEGCILGGDPFEDNDRKPDEESFTPFTGNAGAEATHWYRDTVMIMIPKAGTMRFLLKAFAPDQTQRNDILPLLNDHFDQVYHNRDDRQARSNLAAICNFVLGTNKSYIASGGKLRSLRTNYFSDEVIGRLVDAICLLGSVSSITVVADAIVGELPLNALQSLSRFLRRSCFRQARAGLEALITSRATTSGRLAAVKELCSGQVDFTTSSGEPDDVVTPWANRLAIRIAREFVVESTCASRMDGVALAITTILFGQTNWVSEFVAKRVAENKTKTAFALGFLATWINDAPTKFSDQFILDIFASLWRPILANLDFTQSSVSNTLSLRMFSGTMAESTKKNRESEMEAEAKDLAVVLAFWMQRNTPDDRALERLLSRTATAIPDKLHTIVIPSLRLLLVDMNEADHDTLQSRLHKLFVDVLVQYLQIYVQEQPPARPDWSRPPASCGCGVCYDLNLFLANDTEETVRFRASKNDRHHLHIMLDTDRSGCTHESEGFGANRILVVSKRDRQKQKLDAWQKRCIEAHAQLTAFDQARLRKVLEENCRTVIGMRSIILDYTAAPEVIRKEWARQRAREEVGVAQTSSSQGTTAHVAGVKRKAEDM